MSRCTVSVLLLLGALVPGVADAAEAPGSATVTVRNAYVDAYLQGQPEGVLDPAPAAPPPSELASPLLDGLEVAGPWLKLMGASDAERQWVESPCEPADGLEARTQLCGLRWRKNNAFSDWSTSLDEFSRGMKSRVVGKGLADHLEVDIDSSPEIRFRWEFE